MLSRRTVVTLLPAVGLAAASGEALAALASSPFAIDTLTEAPPTTDLRRVFAAGMTGAVVDLVIYPRTEANASAELNKWAAAAVAPDVAFRIVRQPSDFQAAKDARQFAVVLNCQDAAILEAVGDTETDRFNTLKTFYDLGLRVLQLTYNDRNKIGGGYWEDTQVPLSLYGRRLVAEMNRLGMVIDVSHCGEMTTLDAIKTSSRPMAVTHAACRALFDNARNKSDTVLRALADRGGYFGVYNMTLWMTAQPVSSVSTICDHIDHAVKVGGVDLVGFGSDHPPLGEPKSNAEYWVNSMTQWTKANRALGRDVGLPPNGHVYAADLNGPDRLVRIADELGRRRYRSADIDKIPGLNFIRVFNGACG
jgi:membrane dipeptidase